MIKILIVLKDINSFTSKLSIYVNILSSISINPQSPNFPNMYFTIFIKELYMPLMYAHYMLTTWKLDVNNVDLDS
jgi:hypothetical protein